MNALEIDNFFNGVNRMSNLQIKFDKPSFQSYFKPYDFQSNEVAKRVLNEAKVWLNLYAASGSSHGERGVKISMTKIGDRYHVLEFHFNSPNKSETNTDDNKIFSDVAIYNSYASKMAAVEAIYKSVIQSKKLLFLFEKIQFFIDTLTILLYNIIIKKEKDKTKMKESTLKKYNKTQLENYVNKAKEQVKFWQEQLELAEKVLVTKTKEKDFEDGLYIADAEKSSWFLVVVKNGEVTEVNNCNPLLNLYKIDPYRPLKIKLVKG